MYLLHRYGFEGGETLVAHVNHGARGRESDEDMRFVETMARNKDLPVRVKRVSRNGAASSTGTAFEERARDLRYAFLRELQASSGAGKILLAHTADDQVETVLMRVLEGAGISGLKGIPRKTADGIERPMLDTWREEILADLHKHKISYRVDKSNSDTRFERNWIRHVLIPLLEKRYGKSVKKRIFALGERFREIDDFMETAARRWIKRNGLRFPRKSFETLPSALRKMILQIICFERVGVAPNERLLESMDRLIVSGGASARLNVGKGVVLRNRYSESIMEIDAGKSQPASRSSRKPEKLFHAPALRMEEKRKISAASLKLLSKGERAAAFDRDEIILPLSVRPMRAGDRIRPFGLAAEKKVKEILIDRKVPREERWGRPVVCDPKGTILWIPGVIRSAHAPVTGRTKCTVILHTLELGRC
ncbi:MAG: tRNA(Ile)-lysidine synthase [Actinobacteria bacterium]|nr:tRNA(Ile)-lysidine synthase [Actinomycetota bacterium]